MELERLYESIARLKALGVVVDSYSGRGALEDEVDEQDGMVLTDFMEYIYVSHSRNRPDWLEAFYQVLTWQFETFHQSADGYYDNIYGESPRELQVKTADFLEEHGYSAIAAQYRRGMGPPPWDMRAWMGDNIETVWQFCLDILEAHRLDWPEPEERESDA